MKAVIFDLFGTLVGIENPSHPYRRLLADVRDPAARHAVMCMGVSLPHLSRTLGLGVSPEVLAQCELDIENEVSRIHVFPEVREVLQELRDAGVLVLVSSNLARPYGRAREHLEGLVDYWNFSFDTGYLKPHPAMLLAPAKAFGLRPQDCAVIGDSLVSDGGAAQAAGMRFVHLQRNAYPGSLAARNLREAVAHLALPD